MWPFRSQSPQQAFWSWFVKNQEALLQFERHQDRLAEPLAAHLAKVHPGLGFEFGPTVGGRRQFVLSAGGKKEVFPVVKALGEAAPLPALKRWTISQFLPRRKTINDIAIGDYRLDTRRLEVSVFAHDGKITICLFIPGIDGIRDIKPSKQLAVAGAMLLTEVLGELDVETKVGAVRFLPVRSEADVKRIPLARLAETFDRLAATLPPA